MKKIKLYSVFLASLLLFTSLGYAQSKNLLSNANFSERSVEGYPRSWDRDISHVNHLARADVSISLETEGEDTYYKIQRSSKEIAANVGKQTVEIPFNTGQFKLTAKMRGVGIQEGEQRWQAPGIAIAYVYMDGKPSSKGLYQYWTYLPYGDSTWGEYETTFPVLPGAKKVEIALTCNGWSGTMMITDIELIAIPETN